MGSQDSKVSIWRVSGGMGLMFLGAFLLVSLATHDPFDKPLPDYPVNQRVRNACGEAGAYMACYVGLSVGWSSYGLAVWIFLAGVVLARRSRDGALMLVGTTILLAAGIYGTAVFMSADTDYSSVYKALPGPGGGILGMLTARATFSAIGRTGSWLVFVLLSLMGLWLVFGIKLVEAVAKLWSMRPAIPDFPRVFPAPAITSGEKAESQRAESSLTIEMADPDEVIASFGEAQDKDLELLSAEDDPAADSVEEFAGGKIFDAADVKIEEIDAAADDTAELEPKLFVDPGLDVPGIDESGISADTVEAAGNNKEEAGSASEDVQIEDVPVETVERKRKKVSKVNGENKDTCYELPSLSLLDPPDKTFAADDEAEIREKAQILEKTVNEFSIKARVVRMQRGPVITMYELALAAGIKVSRVESLADDLAMALKAPNVRIVAPLPGKSTVGVEVPNTRREIVRLIEILQEENDSIGKKAIPIFLGRDAAGAPMVSDLSQAPHMLIAGTTGSGKSVCINALITSILMTRSPEEVKLLLIDPKSVELSDFRDVPHLISPVVTDMKKAAAVLEWACKKMDERFALLSRVGVRNISGYNKMKDAEKRRRLDPEGDANLDEVQFQIPHIVIIVDELGELMMVAAKEVENSVIRLAQKSRAVGIHLVCATQRPSVDVITGLIKSNLPCRIAFKVSAKVDSRTILDRNGGEKLLGRGDMLYLPPGTSRLTRGQGVFVSDEEIGRVTEFVKKQGGPDFIAELRQWQNKEAITFASKDEFYIDAVRVVLAHQRGSVSLLQRKLGIGYGRAARLVDMMAEQGIVGDYKGSQAREVLMSLEEWEAQLEKQLDESSPKKKRAG